MLKAFCGREVNHTNFYISGAARILPTTIDADPTAYYIFDYGLHVVLIPSDQLHHIYHVCVTMFLCK